MIFDFINWPGIREMACRTPEMQTHKEWLGELALSVACDWPHAPEAALRQNPITGETDLTQEAMVGSKPSASAY